MRDLDKLRRMAAEHGAYASALLDILLPWTKMRQVYALLGLVKKWGPRAPRSPPASAGLREVELGASVRGGR